MVDKVAVTKSAAVYRFPPSSSPQTPSAEYPDSGMPTRTSCNFLDFWQACLSPGSGEVLGKPIEEPLAVGRAVFAMLLD